MDRDEIRARLDAMRHDLSNGLAVLRSAHGALERRTATLETARDATIAAQASHGAQLEERRRDIDRTEDASREHDVTLAKVVAAIDELKTLPQKIEALRADIELLKKGGDAAQVAKAKQLGLGGAATGAASFIAMVVILVIKSLMEK